MIDLLIVTGGSKGIGKNIVLNSSETAKKVLAIGSSDLINDVSDEENNIYTIKRDISRIDQSFDELSDFLQEHNPSSIGLALCASKPLSRLFSPWSRMMMNGRPYSSNASDMPATRNAAVCQQN